MTSITHDERARVAHALRQHENELAAFFEDAPVGLQWLAADGTILRANRAELELLGYTADEYVGRNVADFHADPAVGAELLRRLGRGETLHDFETRLRRKDGSIRHALVDARIVSHEGVFIHACCLTRDEARTQALAAVRVKSEFLANMSHEIRTPMTAILGYAQLLSDSRIQRDDRTKYIQTIRRNGEYLLALINDVLDLSKIDAGKLVVEKVPCSPAELIAEMETLMRARTEAKGLHLGMACRGPVGARVMIDPTRVRQILVNLVGNAIKFTEAGDVGVELEAEPIANGRTRLRFSVTDTGIGIAPEVRRRLFEPFVQADATTTRRFGGTGLGLAISARVAEALGGTIGVRSEPGRGSTFTLTFDAEPAPAIVAVRSPRTVARTRDAQALPRLRGRILLAEDAPDNQRLLSYYLRKAGAEVVVADDGRMACELATVARAAGKPFDLILMDMQMPAMDGYDASALLRRLGHREPIIAVTAHAMEGDRQRCLDVGCTDYVAKPVDRGSLLRCVQRNLRGLRHERPRRVGRGESTTPDGLTATSRPAGAVRRAAGARE